MVEARQFSPPWFWARGHTLYVVLLSGFRKVTDRFPALSSLVLPVPPSGGFRWTT